MRNAAILCCPVCGGALSVREKAVSCLGEHSFDIAREGYVNLLRSSKSGDRTGDSKESARSRRNFLDKGYYSPLRDALTALFSDRSGTVLDICCGEGYYTSALKGEYEETNLGTPQGGNLSPLLSNIMLNELDKELEA